MLEKAIISWICNKDEDLPPNDAWTLDDFMKQREGNLRGIGCEGDALFIAAKCGKTNKFFYLLNKFTLEGREESLKESLTKTNIDGKNILHVAACFETFDVVKKVHRDNCEIIDGLIRIASALHIPDYVNQQDSAWGASALHFAARNLACNNLKALVRNGADTKLRISSQSSTASLLNAKNHTAFEHTLASTEYDKIAKQDNIITFLFQTAIKKNDVKEQKDYKDAMLENLRKKRLMILSKPVGTDMRNEAVAEYEALRVSYKPLLRQHRSKGLILWYHETTGTWPYSAKQEENEHKFFMKELKNSAPRKATFDSSVCVEKTKRFFGSCCS